MPEVTVQQALNLAAQHHQAGRLADAENIYRQILQHHPNEPNALHLLGLVAHQAGHSVQGLELIDRSVALTPDVAMYHGNRGTVLQALGRFDEADAAFRRAIELDPKNAIAFYNWGRLLAALGRSADAERAYRKAIEFNPNYPEAHNNLAALVTARGELLEAEQTYRRGIALRRTDPDIHNNLAGNLEMQGRLDESIAEFREALALRPSYVVAHSGLIFALTYAAGTDPKELFQEHLRFAEKFEAPLAASILPHANNRAPDRRLKIGFVSPDLWQHSVSFFIEPILEARDREQIEVICYADVAKPDHVTKRLQELSDHWRGIETANDEQVAQQIRRDQIDILVDLAGHSTKNRLLLFARKPAPIQVTYLGYPNTTGLRAIDYRITDSIADLPGESDDLHTEKLVRLSRCAWCFRPAPDAPDVEPPPSQHAGHIMFGSFNNFAKVNAKLMEMWARLLAAVPNSKLLIKVFGLDRPNFQEKVRARFAEAGVAADRLELFGTTATQRDHLAFYHRLDIALDTFPYNGTTTTCQALWMGVPVVTLGGTTHHSRVGASLLSAVGLADLVAHSPDEYVEIAATLARDGDRLAALRRTLRDRMKSSPLTDAASLARVGSRVSRDVGNMDRETMTSTMSAVIDEILERGFVKLPGLVPPARIDAALRAINSALDKKREKLDGLPRTDVILDLLRQSPASTLARDLLGGIKPPKAGQIALRFPRETDGEIKFDPHLDGMHTPWNDVPKGTIGNFAMLAGIMLSDTPRENAGNFTVWPGTHVMHAEYFRQHTPQSLLEGMPKIELPEPEQIIARAGDVVFAHYLLAHTAAPNFSPHIRYAVFFRITQATHEQTKWESMMDPWLQWPGVRANLVGR